MVSYSCPSCGAEIMTAESTAATECYYCGNPVVLGSRLSGEFKPDSVIPFALTKDMAVDAFMKMCGKKKFLPAGFANKKQFEKMQGVYFPYWYVDEKMQSSAVATGTAATQRPAPTACSERAISKSATYLRRLSATSRALPQRNLRQTVRQTLRKR